MKVLTQENIRSQASKATILIARRRHWQPKALAIAHLAELEQLAGIVGLQTVAHLYQSLEPPHPSTFIRKGKINEVLEQLKAYKEAVLLFDEDLSPTQLRNLEKTLQVHIYDRSLLILEIFLRRARTAQARLQVNVARYEYLLPRLTRRWTHLERQRGGISTRGGMGEKEIETDRRQIRNRILHLKKQLLQVEKQNRTQRKNRRYLIRIALVGYTNAGKSTLMKALTQAEVETANKLFATVDTTVRRLRLGTQNCLLSDTVGFIRKLPHGLIESFKSTLAEAQEADLLIHVADISQPSFEEQVQVVERTLEEIGISGKPMLLVFNKTDAVAKNEGTIKNINAYERAGALHTRYPYVAQHYGSAENPNQVKKLKKLLSVQINRLSKHLYSMSTS